MKVWVVYQEIHWYDEFDSDAAELGGVFSTEELAQERARDLATGKVVGPFEVETLPIGSHLTAAIFWQDDESGEIDPASFRRTKLGADRFRLISAPLPEVSSA